MRTDYRPIQAVENIYIIKTNFSMLGNRQRLLHKKAPPPLEGRGWMCEKEWLSVFVAVGVEESHKSVFAVANFVFERADPPVKVFLVPVGPVFGPHFGFDASNIGL